MGAVLRVDVRQVEDLARRLEAMGREYLDLTEPLTLVGIRIQGTREDVFALEGSPIRWKRSRRAIREGGKTLQDTRALLDSMTSQIGAGVIFDATPLRVEVGSVLPQAVHDRGFSGTVNVSAHTRSIEVAFGRPITPRGVSVKAHPRKMRIPVRQFTNLRTSDRKAIVEVIESWQRDVFEREARS